MKFRVDHAAEFINSELERLTRRRDDIAIRMQLRKVAYEAKFFPKLFGWKYENSMDYVEAPWDFNLGDTLIKFGYEILYSKKVGLDMVDLPTKLDQLWQNWMISNDILR